MIAFDTNVLLRLLVDDDRTQNNAAHARFNAAWQAGETVYLSHVVLAETAWTLRAAYAWDRTSIAAALSRILFHPAFEVDDRLDVETALEAFKTGPADFADYLIAAIARARGSITTYTFDRAAARTVAFTLLDT